MKGWHSYCLCTALKVFKSLCPVVAASQSCHGCNLRGQVVKTAKQTQARKAKAAGGTGYADDDSKPAEQPKRCATRHSRCYLCCVAGSNQQLSKHVSSRQRLKNRWPRRIVLFMLG